MPADPHCRRVLVLCQHDLLGEGIADLLRQRGVEVTIANAGEPDTLASCLEGSPCLVVVERADAPCLAQVRAAWPNALVMDVGAVVERGYPRPGSLLLRFEAILDAVMRASDAADAPVEAGSG